MTLQEQKQVTHIESMYRVYHKAHVSGISYQEWRYKSDLLYRIDANNNVISIARGPKHERAWKCNSYVAAKRRIYKLITYKGYDHYIKGHNFMYDISLPRGINR